MTRWAMVADLTRCVGCQTCTSACKQANATAPGVQWRKVLDIEAGEFPDVTRTFMPVGCMHCADPPCLDVCPSTATGKRQDGIVTIDYELCIGCAYCAVACPYQARFRVDTPNIAFGGGKSMRHEQVAERLERRGVAQKCTFCIDRIDPGLEQGLTPGIDHEATPACVNSCIADALHFGDMDNPDSNVSRLLAENNSFTMHQELSTAPGFHYIWDGEEEELPKAAQMVADPVGMAGVAPKLQTHWDWRAAINFILGGTGAGLFIAASLVGLIGKPPALVGLIALVFVATGLFFVWLEIGRPWRFMNVYLHAKRSWMTREAMVAPPFLALGLVSVWSSWTIIWLLAALLGLAFIYCQGMILRAAKGIPAWRQPGIVQLIMATGLSEGVGILAAIAGLVQVADDVTPSLAQLALIGLLILLVIRHVAWRNYRTALGKRGAPVETFKALDQGVLNLTFHTQLPIAVIVAVGIVLPFAGVVGGLLAAITGWTFKYALITRASYNQGYAIKHVPGRGAGKGARGVQPGWTLS